MKLLRTPKYRTVLSKSVSGLHTGRTQKQPKTDEQCNQVISARAPLEKPYGMGIEAEILPWDGVEVRCWMYARMQNNQDIDDTGVWSLLSGSWPELVKILGTCPWLE